MLPAHCRARCSPILVPSGAGNGQGGIWTKCVIPGLPLSTHCPTATPQPHNLILYSAASRRVPTMCSCQLAADETKKPCRDPGSNRGPSDLQSDTLPTELSRLGKPRFQQGITNHWRHTAGDDLPVEATVDRGCIRQGIG